MGLLSKWVRRATWGGWLSGICWIGTFWCAGAEVEDCRKLLLKGQYTNCMNLAEQAIQARKWDEGWPLNLAKAQLAVGRYPEALKTATNALERYRFSIPLRLLAYQAFKANGRTDEAQAVLDELRDVASSLAQSSRSPARMVALGQAALLLNADANQVLVNCFDEAKRIDPKNREVYLASGELALEKHDYDLAAKTFDAGLEVFANDPDLEFGLARAYAPSDASETAAALETVLEENPNHVGALLLLADHAVDAEAYKEADGYLTRALAVNPWEPEAWAYRAVLAHLRNQSGLEAEARATALKYWATNPRVDQLIGRKLSQKYRFAEGAPLQRQALRFDPEYLPAKLQLGQDLLRLGQEAEGWQLVDAVQSTDGYDKTAYNLGLLHDDMAKFQTLTNEHFIVRMAPREAALYGDRVLALLERARATLGAKYGLLPEATTIVEIFPEQKDFAVRTFGMPHNPGFLGVCFGRVITANSPAAQSGHPANWEAVLWHEFCHVITLQMTKNRMPRWLSEGISVYEEGQAKPAWGEAMNPRYREMILGEDFTPLSKLSGAFMSPKGEFSVQFAYFESSLAVRYLVQTYGLSALKQILADLGDGMDVNEAIARHTAALDKAEKEFAAFARQQAQQLGPGLDWTKPEGQLSLRFPGEPRGTNTLRRAGPRSRSTNGPIRFTLAPTNRSPTQTAAPTSSPARTAAAPGTRPNYWKLMEQAEQALTAKRWAEAKAPLNKLLELYPDQTGAQSAYLLLAMAHRGLQETNQERQVLAKLASLDADVPSAYLRLMELDQGASDWPEVATNAERYLAVNPLIPQPYRYLAQACEALNQNDAALRAYERLLLLDPPDPAEVHFHLARLLRQKGDLAGAKRQVLQALEEAPRYRDAQRLLLELEQATPGATSAAPASPLAQSP